MTATPICAERGIFPAGFGFCDCLSLTDPYKRAAGCAPRPWFCRVCCRRLRAEDAYLATDLCRDCERTNRAEMTTRRMPPQDGGMCRAQGGEA